MRQAIKARYHDGVLQPMEPLTLANDAEVELTIETIDLVSAEDILERAARVYLGLTTEQVAQMEALALDRRRFFREPPAQCHRLRSFSIPIFSPNSSSSTRSLSNGWVLSR
jgi:predicted DNA-binding antitoxin AbrB/MazE fold protein